MDVTAHQFVHSRTLAHFIEDLRAQCEYWDMATAAFFICSVLFFPAYRHDVTLCPSSQWGFIPPHLKRVRNKCDVKVTCESLLNKRMKKEA